MYHLSSTIMIMNCQFKQCYAQKQIKIHIRIKKHWVRDHSTE